MNFNLSTNFESSMNLNLTLNLVFFLKRMNLNMGLNLDFFVQSFPEFFDSDCKKEKGKTVRHRNNILSASMQS